MNKSGIEWCDFTSNPVRGECPVDCSYCYVKSFRTRYGWHKDIRFYPAELEAIRRRKKSARIFVGSTIELFHDKTIQYMPEIMDTVKACPWHTILFLTKQPQNLQQWSPFPPNVYVGVTACNASDAIRANKYMAKIQAKVKYLSIEPMQDWQLFPETIEAIISYYNWVILGSQTRPYRPPQISDVEEIIRACDKAGVKVFLKYNLVGHIPIEEPFYTQDESGWAIRQELPKGEER